MRTLNDCDVNEAEAKGNADCCCVVGNGMPHYNVARDAFVTFTRDGNGSGPPGGTDSWCRDDTTATMIAFLPSLKHPCSSSTVFVPWIVCHLLMMMLHLCLVPFLITIALLLPIVCHVETTATNHVSSWKQLSKLRRAFLTVAASQALMSTEAINCQG